MDKAIESYDYIDELYSSYESTRKEVESVAIKCVQTTARPVFYWLDIVNDKDKGMCYRMLRKVDLLKKHGTPDDVMQFLAGYTDYLTCEFKTLGLHEHPQYELIQRSYRYSPSTLALLLSFYWRRTLLDAFKASVESAEYNSLLNILQRVIPPFVERGLGEELKKTLELGKRYYDELQSELLANKKTLCNGNISKITSAPALKSQRPSNSVQKYISIKADNPSLEDLPKMGPFENTVNVKTVNHLISKDNLAINCQSKKTVHLKRSPPIYSKDLPRGKKKNQRLDVNTYDGKVQTDKWDSGNIDLLNAVEKSSDSSCLDQLVNEERPPLGDLSVNSPDINKRKSLAAITPDGKKNAFNLLMKSVVKK